MVSRMFHVCHNNASRSESNRAIPGMKPEATGTKPGNNRNEAKWSWQAASKLFGHYMVTTSKSLRFSNLVS